MSINDYYVNMMVYFAPLEYLVIFTGIKPCGHYLVMRIVEDYNNTKNYMVLAHEYS